MPFYTNSDYLYRAMQNLFERLAEKRPGPMDALSASRLTIRFKLKEPSAEILVNGRMQPARLMYGSSSLRPDLDVELSADLLHQILLDEASIKKSIAARQLKVTGPVWKTTLLADILQEGKSIYPAILRENGLL
jgi:hypothetical protein